MTLHLMEDVFNANRKVLCFLKEPKVFSVFIFEVLCPILVIYIYNFEALVLNYII